ncbi:MAG: PEP/pyruvate-binding domain-containing protein [Patescibacteria group bacterium]
MELIRDFKQINKNNASIAGGKGASLGEMTQAGIPVPPGFVILSASFEKFLEETDLDVEIDSILHTVNHKEIHTVENASEKIQALIIGADMPKDIEKEIKKYFKKLNTKYVAVRSSATAEDSASAAWAGQLDSFLNTTEKNLLENVKKCWASLFTPRAIFYRFEKELHKQKISVAVVVQKMVESEASGVAFSVHPVTQDRNQLIIEAGFGLGEAIVSGQITPDSYVVEKEPRRIIDKNVSVQERGLYRSEKGGPSTGSGQANEWINIPKEKGEKQVLSDKQILELSNILLGIEKHYGFPCDIEWAFEKGKFYITQSRPITTLNNKEGTIDKKPIVYEKLFSRDFPLSLIQIWTNAESTNKKEWTRKEQPFMPYIVFEKKDNIASVYYDKRGIDWLTCILIEITKKDQNFLSTTVLHYKKLNDTLNKYLRKNRPLSIKELIAFMELTEKEWSWVEAYWWISESLPEQRNGLKIPDNFVQIREETQSMAEEWNNLIKRSLDVIYPSVKKYWDLLTIEEIKTGNLPSIEELIKRSSGFFYTDKTLFVSISRNDIEKKFNIKFEQENVSKNTDEILGQMAYGGLVCGTVKKVEKRGDINKVKRGDIIISYMTMPEFIPAMKRAAAFVTDEGGVLCHAAIISRELKKPCIIGTKIATQVLKDGDLVEVDANKGIVRILNKTAESVVNYEPVFKLPYSNIFISELLFRSSYKDIEGVAMTIKNGKWKLFIQKFILDKLSEERFNKVLKGSDFKSFESGSLKAADEILKLSKRDLKEIDNKEFINLLEELFKIGGHIFEYYMQTEFFYFTKIENQLQEYVKGKINIQDVLSGKVNLKLWSDDKRKLANYIIKIQHLKFKLRQIINEALIGPNAMIAKLLEQLVVRTGREDSTSMVWEEIKECLNGHKVVDVSRRHAYSYLEWNTVNKKMTIYLGKDAEEKIKVLNRNMPKDKLIGTVACRGKAKGKVKVIQFSINDEKNINKMEEGDILVSDTTGPEMMIAIKRAAAIVTDEGGLMSHAAVVSREFNIPCIVGTKYATDVLKDGDMIEVDADNGIIKKINERK